jgi:Ca2+-binding EF-hand superfamily protein
MDLDKLNFEVPEVVRELVPEQKLIPIAETFAEIDTNKDGRIGLDEHLNSALVRTKAKLTREFNYLDTDKDGYIDFEEFVAAIEPNYLILKRFRELDIDHNGFLAIEDALRIADQLELPLSNEQVETIMHEADRDGDGRITYYEYLGAIAHIGFQ